MAGDVAHDPADAFTHGRDHLGEGHLRSAGKAQRHVHAAVPHEGGRGEGAFFLVLPQPGAAMHVDDDGMGPGPGGCVDVEPGILVRAPSHVVPGAQLGGLPAQARALVQGLAEGGTVALVVVLVVQRVLVVACKDCFHSCIPIRDLPKLAKGILFRN